MINSLDFKIKSVYPILRQSEKRAADYILNNKKGVADMSMKDFAEKAGVSQPTVMRMVKAFRAWWKASCRGKKYRSGLNYNELLLYRQRTGSKFNVS